MSKLTSLCATGVATVLSVTLMTASPAEAVTPHHFRNCDALHHRFPHGVGLRHAHDHTTSGDPVTNFARRPRWYRKNTSLDADGDHIACESH